MKNFKIKSYCKINLSLRVLKKLKNGYHNITSLITFCDLHDIILISKIKNSKDVINFTGKFNKGISKKFNTITNLLSLLRKRKLLKNQSFRITIKKNIPQGSGLGGGSSNAASLLKYLNKKMRLNLKKEMLFKIGKRIGFDVPVMYEKRNIFLNGDNKNIFKIRKKFNFNLIIVYPNIICSTKKIYQKNVNISFKNSLPSFNNQNKDQLFKYLKNESNDLQGSAIKIYPKIEKLINYIGTIRGCFLSRMTGSGSACIGIFTNKENAIYAKKLIKLKYPKYWCVISKTI